MAIDAHQIFTYNNVDELHKMPKHSDWLFGHISYSSTSTVTVNSNPIGFEQIQFFVPKIILFLNATEITIHSYNVTPQSIVTAINNTNIPNTTQPKVAVQPKVTKAQYIEHINALKQHILRGDCYEINYCQEFYSANAAINPIDIFSKLNAITPNPYAALYKQQHSYVLCQSPERYISKVENILTSQPIKGTIKRNTGDAQNDELLKQQLQQSPKEQSENVMIVDLVRNDLSRVCMPHTVKVSELFGVHTYPQVHHLISTVQGSLLPNAAFADIIQATFPMGSMTGAPKVKVMELISKYEATNRGLFSGTIGYIMPNGNFDFNVVIRSILYNAATQYISYYVGSGITIYCNAEQEYEECLLKAKAMQQVLLGN